MRSNNINSIKAVIFDLDGVLIRSIRVWHASLNKVFQTYGKPTLEFEEYQRLHAGGNPRKIIQHYFPEKDPDIILKAWIDHWMEHVNEIHVYEGIKEVLDSISQPKAIVTQSNLSQAEVALVNAGIRDKFEFILDPTMYDNPKPAPDGILKACEILKVNPEEAVYVGDTPTDVKAAKVAGCEVICVLTTNTKESLDGADTIISNISELPNFV